MEVGVTVSYLGKMLFFGTVLLVAHRGRMNVKIPEPDVLKVVRVVVRPSVIATQTENGRYSGNSISEVWPRN